MLPEMGMGREVLVFAMLEDEDAAFGQQSLFKDECWNGGQFLQGVRRVGKDKVELLFARLDEAEGIAADR